MGLMEGENFSPLNKGVKIFLNCFDSKRVSNSGYQTISEFFKSKLGTKKLGNIPIRRFANCKNKSVCGTLFKLCCFLELATQKSFLDFQFSHLQAVLEGLGPDFCSAMFLIYLHFSATQANAASGFNKCKVSKMDISKLAKSIAPQAGKITRVLILRSMGRSWRIQSWCFRFIRKIYKKRK
jgi:hypothetical protein